MPRVSGSEMDQTEIYDVLIKVAKRMSNEKRDLVAFPVVCLSATSMMVAEMASLGSLFYEEDGHTKIMAFILSTFAEMLRDDLANKMAEKRKETRQ